MQPGRCNRRQWAETAPRRMIGARSRPADSRRVGVPQRPAARRQRQRMHQSTYAAQPSKPISRRVRRPPQAGRASRHAPCTAPRWLRSQAAAAEAASFREAPSAAIGPVRPRTPARCVAAAQGRRAAARRLRTSHADWLAVRIRQRWLARSIAHSFARRECGRASRRCGGAAVTAALFARP